MTTFSIGRHSSGFWIQNNERETGVGSEFYDRLPEGWRDVQVPDEKIAVEMTERVPGYHVFSTRQEN